MELAASGGSRSVIGIEADPALCVPNGLRSLALSDSSTTPVVSGAPASCAAARATSHCGRPRPVTLVWAIGRCGDHDLRVVVDNRLSLVTFTRSIWEEFACSRVSAPLNQRYVAGSHRRRRSVVVGRRPRPIPSPPPRRHRCAHRPQIHKCDGQRDAMSLVIHEPVCVRCECARWLIGREDA